MDGPNHVPVDTSTAVPGKSILKKKPSHVEEHQHHVECDGIDATRSSISSSMKRPTDEDARKQSCDSAGRRAQWDEMNILATYHPADKDYGHMKIDDPPTPYHEYTQEMADDDNRYDVTDSNTNMPRERRTSFSENTVELDPNALAEKLANPPVKKPTKEVSSDSDDESHMTDEQRVKKADFKNKRKQHYNEFQAVQLARQLLENEVDDEEEDNENGVVV